MPRPEVGTPKWISNQWKKKGLNKLRWYCGLCGVSCRDANGFQLHLSHENHLRREVEAEERGKTRDTERRYYADAFSEAFERSFLRYLVKEKLGQRVRAHEAYRAVNPDDRAHKIMAETCWGTLGRFVADLRERGELDAWRDDDGWIVSLAEGAPACEWATLSDLEARKLHSRLDESDAPVYSWKDVGRVTGTTTKQRGGSERSGGLNLLDDDAFAQAARAARGDVDDASAAAAKEVVRDFDEEQPRQQQHHQQQHSGGSSSSGATALLGGDVNPTTTERADAPASIKERVAFALTTTGTTDERAPKRARKTTTRMISDDEPSHPKSSSESWLRADLVVKAKVNKERRKVKVVDVDGATATVEALDDPTVRARITDAETVIPNIGKPVRVVRGEHAGTAATLLALKIDAFQARVAMRRAAGESPLELDLPYDHVCKDLALLRDQGREASSMSSR